MAGGRILNTKEQLAGACNCRSKGVRDFSKTGSYRNYKVLESRKKKLS
jgi:hypothetical protein